jgi:2-polyprenyl-3-methyl-5-hydroxy-6-metoxy-1,4-benzoquinol methylase
MFEQNGAQTVGVEISQEAIRLAKENGTKGEIFQGNLDDIENVNIDKKFDLISIKLVLAFVKNRATLLDWCLKHLAENGKVIINSPVSTKEKPCLKPGIDINLLEIETLLGFIFKKVELLDVDESSVGPVHTYSCSN